VAASVPHGPVPIPSFIPPPAIRAARSEFLIFLEIKVNRVTQAKAPRLDQIEPAIRGASLVTCRRKYGGNRGRYTDPNQLCSADHPS